MKYLLIGALITFLTACSNSLHFSRFGNEDILLGQTRLSEMADIMRGDPLTVSRKKVNGKQVTILEYTRIGLNEESDSKAPGVIPRRTLLVLMHNDIVVGTTFFSSFAVDSTRFNPELAQQIEKNTSNREDIIKIFGMPNVVYSEQIGINGQKVIGYRYQTMHFRAAGGNGYQENVRLMFVLDENDTVTDFKLIDQRA